MDTALQIEWVATERLFPNPANPRRNDAAVPHVAASIRRFGWQQPVVAKPSGEVIAGHTRLKAALDLGHETVPVVWFDGSDLDAAAFLIADNRSHAFSEWDEPALAKLLEELRREDALEGVGFTEDDLRAIAAAALGGQEVIEDEPVEPPEHPVTETGDLWTLGRHRLLCGDATHADAWERLLGDAQPALCVTDPPYGVSYDPEWRSVLGSRPARTGKVCNDDRADWREVWPLLPCDVFYVWHGGVHTGEVLEGLVFSEIFPRAQIVWNKPHFPIGRGHYHWRHEPCWYAVRKGRQAHWIGDRKQTTVWDITLDRNVEGGHSTQKPVECMARPIRNHEGDVIDPFLGSGTTLIGAQQLGRTCYGTEISPGYCDAIIIRWQRLTNGEAIHEATGQSYRALAEERHAR